MAADVLSPDTTVYHQVLYWQFIISKFFSFNVKSFKQGTNDILRIKIMISLRGSDWIRTAVPEAGI